MNYLFEIINKDEESLAKKVLTCQINNPTKGDFVSTEKKDLEDCKIDINIEDMKYINKNTFKKYVKESVKKNGHPDGR